MSRIFKDGFLRAYCEFAEDGFSPPQFHVWTALSIVAAALERRVWLPWNTEYTFYPNIYVILTSRPGQGKSTAAGKGVRILREMNRRYPLLNILPTQMTEASFIELMGHGRSFIDASSGKELTHFQNAAYFYSSEASNSLKNIFGDFIACLTDFYDCPEVWERKVKKDGRNNPKLKNVCMNFLACSTFDYLGKLVSDENIQGGFASRILYVQQNVDSVREQSWQNGEDEDIRELKKRYTDSLIEELHEIAQMTGPMRATPEYSAAWEKWYVEHQHRLNAVPSEKLRSIFARTNTSVLKLSMLLSAMESSDRLLKLPHLEKAVELVDEVNRGIPEIFRKSKVAQGVSGVSKSSGVIMNSVFDAIRNSPNPLESNIRSKLILDGFNAFAVNSIVDEMIKSGALSRNKAAAGFGPTLVIAGNPDNYL